MSEDHALWEAIGNLHRARRDLIVQLAEVAEGEGDQACSFCHATPPDVTVLVGPSVSICDRCVELCREVLALRQAAR